MYRQNFFCLNHVLPDNDNVNPNDNDRVQRHERRRSQKTKIIVHKKYLCKEYMDTCVKWRKRKDQIQSTQSRLKQLNDSLKPTLKRLNQLDDNKRISKGKNKQEKPNKADLKEFLDVAVPLEDVADELGEILLDLHPEGAHLKAMAGDLLAKQNEIDELKEEMETLQNVLEKYKLERKLRKNQDGTTPMVRLVSGSHLDLDDDDEEDDRPLDESEMLRHGRGGDSSSSSNSSSSENEDADRNGTDADSIANPYKLQFTGMYKKVAHLEENRDAILEELRTLIRNIGDDINQGAFADLNSNYRENGTMDFVPKTEALIAECTSIEQKLAKDGQHKKRRKSLKSDKLKEHRSKSSKSC